MMHNFIFDKFFSKGVPPVIIRKFLCFLLKHNAYDKFINNVIAQLYPNLELIDVYYNAFNRSYKEPHWNVVCADDLINATLIWRITKEGGDFWAELNAKWCDIVYKEQLSNLAFKMYDSMYYSKNKRK